MRLSFLEQFLLLLVILGGVSLLVTLQRLSNHIHHTQHNVHYDDFIRQKVTNLTSSTKACDTFTSMYQPPWNPILQDLQHSEGFLWQQFFDNHAKTTTLPKRNGLYQPSELAIMIPTGYITRVRAAAVKGISYSVIVNM